MTERNIAKLSQQQFGAQALEYSKSRTFHAGADLDAIVAMAQGIHCDFAVDIGSGAGFTAFAVAPFATTTLATDLVLPMLQHARENAASRELKNVVPALVVAESLPFATNSVGLITCRLAAHHFNDTVAGVQEWARVLEPGGTMILVDTVTPEGLGMAEWMNDIEVRRDPSHGRDLSSLQWIELLTESGFSVEETILTKIPLEYDDWMRRAGASPEATEDVRKDFLNATPEVAEAFGIETDAPLRFFWPCLALKATLRVSN